jgi:predicted Zn-dependent protease
MLLRSRTIRALAVLFAGLNGLACSTPRTDDQQRIRELAEEVRLGRGIAASLLGKYKLDRSRPAQSRYIATVGTYLAQQYGRPELEFRFAILQDGPVNAYACPGGLIFLTRALVNKLGSEDELIAVLVHEIAHVNLGHVYKKLRRPREVSFGATLSRMLSQGGGELGFALGEAVKAGFELLTSEGLGPKLEGEADEAALSYALATGTDGGALYRFLAKTADSQKDLPKSHPRLDERLSQIDRWWLANAGRSASQSKEPAQRKARFKERMAAR